MDRHGPAWTGVRSGWSTSQQIVLHHYHHLSTTSTGPLFNVNSTSGVLDMTSIGENTGEKASSAHASAYETAGHRSTVLDSTARQSLTCANTVKKSGSCIFVTISFKRANKSVPPSLAIGAAI